MSVGKNEKKGNPHALLVGSQISKAIMENSMVFS